MKKNLGWIIAIVLGVLLLAAVVLPWFFTGSGFGMRPYGGMMGREFGGMHPMGWAGMGLGWLFGLAILVLLGLGITSLIKYLSEPRATYTAPASPPERSSCSSCGRASQPDWNTCPYCGNDLKANS